MTFTRRPPPAGVVGRHCRLKGREVPPRLVPVGPGREETALRPSRPPDPSQPVADRPLVGAPPGRGGSADPGPGLVRAASPASAARDPSHLHLAPSGRGGTAAPRPGPVCAAGRRRRRSPGPRPSHMRLAPSGRGGTATPRPGPVGAAGRRRRRSAGARPSLPVAARLLAGTPSGRVALARARPGLVPASSSQSPTAIRVTCVLQVGGSPA